MSIDLWIYTSRPIPFGTYAAEVRALLNDLAPRRRIPAIVTECCPGIVSLKPPPAEIPAGELTPLFALEGEPSTVDINWSWDESAAAWLISVDLEWRAPAGYAFAMCSAIALARLAGSRITDPAEVFISRHESSPEELLLALKAEDSSLLRDDVRRAIAAFRTGS